MGTPLNDERLSRTSDLTSGRAIVVSVAAAGGKQLEIISKSDRDRIVAALAERAIEAAAYYVTPLHLQPAMGHLGWEPGSLPETEKAAAENLALPLWGGIDAEVQERVVATVLDAVGVASARA